MALISIKRLAEAAKARGFKVNGFMGNEHCNYLELFAPDHEGPQAVQHFDSVYSTCFTSLYDRPRCGYGYNSWFNGPWHTGLIQSDDCAVTRLLAHPAMLGVTLD